jgi:hypothetical protein
MWAGFDREPYPDPGNKRGIIRWLWENTNLYWCGYYLAPTPDHRDTSWMGKRQFLKDMGWGLAPLYVGQQEGSFWLTGKRGETDGKQAALFATNEGFRKGSRIYLDIEIHPRSTSKAMIDYYRAWVLAVIDGGYWPGIYCSPRFADLLVRSNPAPIVPAVWAAGRWHSKFGSFGHPYPEKNPMHSGYSQAKIWQHAGEADIHGPHGKLHRYDLNSCYTNDPSNIELSLSSA